MIGERIRFEPVGTSWRLRSQTAPPVEALPSPEVRAAAAAVLERPRLDRGGIGQVEPDELGATRVLATGAPKTRVLLVDDHATLREPLALLMERETDLTVVGQAGSLGEARQALRAGLVADVVVLDLNLPDGNGTDLVKELRTANPHGAVLILTASNYPSDQARAVQAGASGVLNKAVSIAEIIGSVRKLGAGQPICPPNQIIELLRLAGEERERDYDAKMQLGRLTHREREVLGALADGLSDKEIALKLHVSSKTVRVHMANILDKLGLESRLQALIFAVRHGLVDIR